LFNRCVGRGVDAASLYAEYGVGFDFHGPAGAVSRSLVNALADVSGTPLPSDADTEWVKQDWLDAMENLQGEFYLLISVWAIGLMSCFVYYSILC